MIKIIQFNYSNTNLKNTFKDEEIAKIANNFNDYSYSEINKLNLENIKNLILINHKIAIHFLGSQLIKIFKEILEYGKNLTDEMKANPFLREQLKKKNTNNIINNFLYYISRIFNINLLFADLPEKLKTSKCELQIIDNIIPTY